MTRKLFGVAMACNALLVLGVAAQENWPQWRGPDRNGVAQASNLPVTWSATENIAWKTALPSWSAGTPIIWGDRIFITSPSKEEAQVQEPQPAEESRGRRGPRGGSRNPGGQQLLLLCVSKTNGEILWQRELDQGNRLFRKGNNSSPSPVTDGQHVWAVAGTGAINVFDMEGKPVWQKHLQKEFGPFGINWGYASSPTLYDGKLILEVLQGYKTDDPSYIAAYEAKSGKLLWRQERPTDARAESPDAYTTPALLASNGKTEIIITGGDYITSHDPATGKELWRLGGLNPGKERNYRIVASPLVVDGMIYAPTRKKPLLAVRAEAGEKISEENIAWKWDGPAATDVPTPVCDGTYFYMVDDRGMVICLDAKTGAVVWGPERTAQGIVSASPILADGKLFVVNEQAVTTVISAGPAFEILATNELDGSYTLASPAVSGDRLFIRTADYLYCIDAPTDEAGLDGAGRQ